MRVTSELFVSALLRRIQASGGFGAIVRRGNREAGAVFILERARNGETALFGPAPQMVYSEAKPDERCFSRMMTTSDAGEIAQKLEKEARFDSDIWAVEVEPGSIPLSEMITVSQ